MDRKKLIQLFQKGVMEYPVGKHQFWIARRFEIHVQKNQVQLDEYESFSTVSEPESREMFHVGRSILHLKDGRVEEELGDGWKGVPKKTLDRVKA